MKGTILLDINENIRMFEEEEKSKFTRAILEEVGLPLDNVWDDDGSLSTQGMIKLNSILGTFQIQVIDIQGGDLQIYHEDNLIGEWRKPFYILKTDHNQKDPRKKLYHEAQIDYFSIFEEI